MILWCVCVVVVEVSGTGLQWWWLAMLSCFDGRLLLLLLLLLGIEEWVREGLIRQKKGERKKYKIIYRRDTITVQIYTITVAHEKF